MSSPQLITLMRPSFSTRLWQVGGSVANTVFDSRPKSMPFLLKRNCGARYLFFVLLSAMPNEILALQSQSWLFPTVLPAWPHGQRRHSLKSLGELRQSYFWLVFAPCWTHLPDLKRCSQEEVLEIETCFSSFFLSRASPQPSGDSASLLQVPGLLGIHPTRVLLGSLPEWTSGSLQAEIRAGQFHWDALQRDTMHMLC